MRTVITISLNGNAYQLDAVGYDALRAYLQVAEQRLAANPDQQEILADLEQAIADKCNRYLGPHKNVISADEVAEVIREMGPVDGGAAESAAQSGPGREQGGFAQGAGSTQGVGAGSGAAAGRTYTPGEYAEAVGETWTAGSEGAGAGIGSAGAGGSTGAGGFGGAGGSTGAGGLGGAGGSTAAGGSTGAGAFGGAGSSTGAAGSQSQASLRRLYQIRDGAVISGVCKGLAAYLDIDVAVIRVLFVVLALVTGGVWILVYLVMMFVIPFAQTSEQHAAAHGWPFNAEEVIARAKSHYAAFKESEKWRRQQSREQRRMWKDQRKQWRNDRRAWERAGGSYGTPPPPPPPWSAAPPPNATYSSQVVSGVVTPLIELVGAVLFIAFLVALVSIATRHRLFGWSLPGEIPGWVGIVALIVLYRVVVSPLRQARYAAYYGTPFGQGWLALWGVLLWLAAVTFFAWLAWQHWTELQAFFHQLADSLRDLIEHRPAAAADPEEAAIGLLLPAVPLACYTCAPALENSSRMDKSTARTCLVMPPTEM
jgi:phage shock protein PspC (stress-responsive transcriptional regulator)